MEIQIPSPSVFLKRSPPSIPDTVSPPPPSKKSVKPRGIGKRTTNNTTTTTTTQNVAVKPKQSKSRNGCMTCKKKRLKCDETKPSCAQCQKRNVTCEGYKKDYKWRSFEETSFNSKAGSKKKAQSKEGNWSTNLDSAFATASNAFPDDTSSAPALFSPSTETSQYNQTLPDLEFRSPVFPPHNTVFEHDTLADDENSPSPAPPTLETVPSDTTRRQSSQNNDNHDDDADEEIERDQIWSRRQSSPSKSDTNSSSSSQSAVLAIITSPSIDFSSPDMLLLRFDQDTCGILSVKDGPTENPWRTLIWPLAQNSEALYHAISCMTAFHGAYELPQLRVAGVAHMTKSIRNLSTDIANMRLDSALATSLALALSEGWDEKVSTGIQHLRGSKIMVNKALVKHRQDLQQGNMTAQDAIRLKFLCNTFIYLDVIARLTSNEDSELLNFEDILMTVNPPVGDFVEVDPLMGCATTLFPIIGKVANFIQQLRKTTRNSLNDVSYANDLREMLLHWRAPDQYLIERPEDPTSEVQHAIQTAEAYRFATLLYLHQAVPEIPSDPHEVLAKKVLLLLASVPLSSRTTIVQIFPLFAASCEVTAKEDRDWVIERWSAMIARLRIGNVDSCWNVVQEVWNRRDAFEDAKAQRLMRRYTSKGLTTSSMMAEMPTLTRRVTASQDDFEPEYTVRGKLHWIGVMSEWQWEVFLG